MTAPVSRFRKATKQASKLRLGLIGPAGSGKTYTALTVAGALGGRVAVIDTEKGSASKYADLFDFDVLELDNFHPQDYVDAIREACAGGYATVIIDSLSHAWVGKGGALELHDAAVKRQKTQNSFTAWGDVTPHHNALIEAMIHAGCHVIATMRSKTEYVQEKDQNGKTTVRKVGLAPVQRDGMEYEFDVVGDMDPDNTLVVTKTRCPSLSGSAGVIRKPGAEFCRTLMAWLGGAPAPTASAPMSEVQEEAPPWRGRATTQQAMAINGLAKKLGMSADDKLRLVGEYGVERIGQLTEQDAEAMIGYLQSLIIDRERQAGQGREPGDDSPEA